MRLESKKLKLLCGLLFSIFLCACEEEEDIQKWITETESLRIKAEQEGEVVPYREEQFKALKAYFGEINVMIFSLKDDPEKTNAFNEMLTTLDLQQLCDQVLLDYNHWQRMLQRCQRNNFFLCAEEVRTYQSSIKALRNLMSPEQGQRFDKTKSCMEAIGKQ